MTDRTSNIRPNDDSTVGKPSTSSDPLADFTKAEIDEARAWMRGPKTDDPPAPVIRLVEYVDAAERHLTPEEAVALAATSSPEQRVKLINQAAARAEALR